MASTTAIPDTFAQECLKALHDFEVGATPHTFNMSLYLAAATNGHSTTVYTETQEVAAGGGYTTTGNVLTITTGAPAETSGVAFIDFTDRTWTSATFTAASCIIYNDTHASKAACYVGDFGGDKTVSSGTLTVQFPANDSSNAVIRIG